MVRTDVIQMFSSANIASACMPSPSPWSNSAMTTYSVLAGRIREALSDLERVVRRAEELLSNVYTFNLRPLRLKELTENLSPCYQRLDAELAGFVTILSALDKDEP